MWASDREDCCEHERTSAVVAVGRPVPLRRAAGDDDARRVADAVRAAAGCDADVPARPGRRRRGAIPRCSRRGTASCATRVCVGSPLQSWVVDKDFDLDYHVRRSALASPGDERELGVLVSRLHSNPLDLSRPPWEVHLIEGLEGGRFAIYTKMHHALVDGYSGVRLMARSPREGSRRSRPCRCSSASPAPPRGPREPADADAGERPRARSLPRSARGRPARR